MFHTADVSVIHSEKSPLLVNKKLQVTIGQSVENTSTQTDPMAQVPTVLPKTTFDVVTQSGTVHCAQSVQTIPEERPVFHTVNVGVDLTGKLQSVLYENVQATMRQSVENTSTQTDPMAQVPTVLPKTTFDVVTQSGTVHCAQSVQTIPEERPVFHTVSVGLDHTEKSPSLVGKKLQATMRQSVENTSTQTDPMAQVPTVLPKTTFDVVTQSGTVHCAQSVQTIPEERPVFHTVNVGVDLTGKLQSVLYENVQATMRQSVENTSTQTDPMAQVPTVLPKTTFDVVTQSGTVHCAQSVQTIPEERPVFHTVSVGLDHTEKSPSLVGKKLQATMRQSVENTSTQTDPMAQVPTVLPKTTFDVVTQSGTVHCAQSVQTIPEERPVFHTVSVGLDHTEKSPSLVGKKLQATMRQSVENTSTQTDPMAQVPTVLPKTTFDVVTQSGTVHCAQSVQTIPEEQPVFHTVNVGLDHTEKSPSLVGKKLQATMRQSVENTSTQTDPMAQVPTVLPKTTFDVVTQSGTVHCAQSVQTIPEERPVFHTVNVGVDLTGKLQSVLYENVQATMRQSVENTSTQTDPMAQVPTVLPKTTFDVVTQSGTLSLNVGCQAVLISEDLLMNDVAVDHVGSINPCFSQGVQAGTQVECRNVEIQCVIKDKHVVNIRDADAQFDVLCRQQETQTFSLPSTTTKEGSVQHTPTTTQLINKKLQVTVSQSIREAAAQTYESIPVVTVPTMQTIYHSSQTHEISSQTESLGLFDHQTYAHIKSKTIDVETQSGIICKSQGLQTKLDHKPFGMTKENSTQYEAVQRRMINIDIQADARHAVAYRYVQTDESQLIHIKQKHQMNVQTQSGIIQKEQGIQTREEVQTTVNVTDVTVTHEFKTRQINKKLQATIMPQIKDTIIQTELEGTSVFPTATKPTFDVQTQSGSVTINSETQTPHEPKIIPAIKDASVIHEPHHVHTVNKKLQAVVYHPSDDVCLQTDEVTVQPVKPVPQAFSRAPQVEHKQTQAEWLKTKTKTFDIQAQSGIVVKTQSTQTILEERPMFHTADVSVIHSEKSPLLVNKKLQVTIGQSVENTSTQTDPMAQVPTVLPKTTFDVVTQSGTVHCAQSVQTIPEEQPVFHTVNVGLDHTEKSPSLVGKKLQATMRQSVENTSTQTDPMAQVPTVLPKTTFDVVTQSGTVHCAQSVQTIPEEQPVFHTVNVGLDHTEKSPSLVGKKLQATMRQSVENTSTQTDPMAQVPTVLPKTTFDVVTQSGTVHCAQSVQTIPEERPVFHTVSVGVDLTGKLQSVLYENVQATMRQSVENTSTQTDPMAQVPTVLPKTTFDVVTQSGTVHCAQSVQTIPEERPVFHTVNVGLDHTEKSPSLVGKKLQATMRQSVENTSTQTDPMAQVPTVLPKTTFDVVTQSGTVHCAQSVQTIPEERPVFHTVNVGLDHTEKSPSLVGKKLQATMRQSVENTSTQTDPMAQVPTVLPKTTFDVVTQSGTVHCAQSVQTIPEERPVFHTVSVGLDHTEKSPSLVGKKLQATMRQSVENTSTQTDPMAQVPTVLPKTTFDVVTQSGTVHCAQSVQTIPEERPVFHTVNVGVDLTGKLQSVLYENVQATMRQSVENTSTQTDPMAQVPTVLPKTTFDVVTQSGTVHCAQSVQTIPEERPVFCTVDVSVDHVDNAPIVRSTVSSTMHTLPNTSQSTQTIPTKLADTFCQTTLSSITYDVQIQSGVIHSVDGTQTVDLTPPIAMKEMSVVHEKEPTILKGKKLQVRCDSTDLGIQTDQITPIVQPTISSTMHTLPNTSQSTQTIPTKLADTFCQTTLSSITYDVQIQSGVIHSVDGTQTVDLTPPIAMKEMSVVHEKEPTILKGKKLQVRCDSTDLGIQTDQITPIVQPTISSTMHTLPNTSQSTQTIPTKLADTFCQTTLSSITYDVQIQSGVIHSVDGTQTVDLTPPIAMKEMSVVHEKEPTILKGKKLQVRCDSTDLGVQTDHTMSTVHLDSKLTQTALVHYTDVSCQYTELTKPSSTSHVVTSRVVSIQTDVPFSTNIRVDQRNKKFQVNLISPSSPKTPTNVASIGTQTSDYRYQDISIEQVDKTTVSSVDAYMVHDSVSNVTSTSQAIPKIKIDQECQVKITPQQYQKKLQCGPSFSTLKNTSSQTIQDSCLRDHQRTSLSSSIGVQVSNVRPVVTVDTGTQETRPSETSPSPLQVKNKKLQVYPSKLGEQVEEEFIHPQETICKGMSTSLTEITQTDECLLKNTECFKCISRGGDKKTIDKDVQSEEKSIRTKQTASSTVKSNYFTRILQMETIPDKPKAPDTSDVLKLYRESGYRAKGESRDVQTDAFLLGSIQLPESKEVDGVGKISKKTTIVQLEKLTTDKCVDTMPFEKGLIESQTSYHDIQTSERRNVRLPKETPWPEAQATNVLQDIQFEIRHPQMIDSSGSYSPQQNSVSVSARPTTHMLTHAESTSRNGNGKVKTPYQYLKPDVVSWGVQFAPVTLTGVTQTTESSKHKLAIDSSVNISVQTDAVEDDYYIKRVVTTIARKGLSSYCRRGPVAKKIVEHTDLLTSSLPSNLDEEFDEETTIGPRTTKVTTMQKRGDRRVVHEELLTEDYRERGSSLDSRVAHGQFPRETHPQDIDLHEMHEHETDIYTDAEICLQNLLKVWGEQYLLSRLRTIGRYSELSVSLDRSIHTAEKSRLVEAKTQFTSTGNLVSQIRNLENIGTQTSDILLITRPPHKNKRIQRGRSFISGGTNQPPPTRSGSVVSPLSPTTEELTSHHRQHGITSMQTRTSHPFNLATTTFTETTQEQSTFSIEHTVQTYTCPTCGSQANIPVTVHSQIQPQTLPITQLKDAQSQTRFMGQMTTDNNCTYLPTYLSDEEVIRINQSQKIEDREFSMVTWHPAEIRDTERRRDSDTSNQIRDEVWVDSPGKLLELKITGVIVPGTSEIVSASEAFYRGLLRVVYWDYEKLGPRQSSVDSTVSIPLADAVISKAVRLASDRISTETQPSLDAKIVWRTPEIQRSRYLVHSIRPDAGQNKHNPINLDVASAIRAGLIDKETGQMLFTHSVYESPFSTDSPISKKGDSSSDQTERLSVREAIVRGFLVAELIEPESSYITKQSLPFIVPSTSYSHSPTDVDI
uniref:Protein CASC3 n=1 Tax=Schistosoma mansoni TaxID=6183 RepID=A0A5K4F2I5_SCHMA